MAIYPKTQAGKQKLFSFLSRWWRQRQEHPNNHGIKESERNNLSGGISTLNIDAGDRSETDFSTSKGSGESLPRMALKRLFSQPECSVLDGLNEYDEDYTSFVPRGTLLTHDMVREFQRKEKTIIATSEQNRPDIRLNGKAGEESIHHTEENLSTAQIRPSDESDSDTA